MRWTWRAWENYNLFIALERFPFCKALQHYKQLKHHIFMQALAIGDNTAILILVKCDDRWYTGI